MIARPDSVADVPFDDIAELSADKSNVLIVDDLPEKLLLFGTVLEGLRQNLVFVRSGAEALREVMQREFAVILLDVNMPGIDGFETAALIRKHKRSAHTPIIFITACADESQTAKGYPLGTVDYILPPVVPDVLRSKVKVFVDLYLMQRRIRQQADERVALATTEAARRVAEANDRRSNFLSQASRVLSGSLDVSVGTRLLVELLVPEVASLAVLLLVDERNTFADALIAGATPDPRGQVEMVTLDASQLPDVVQAILREALATKRRATLASAALPACSAEAFGLQGCLTLRGAVALPLMIGERALAVLMVGSGQADVGPDARDWAALDELASRAAIAFENARLYRSLHVEIVERRAAEAELQEANQRKDEFLAMLSHELRNPLAPIRNALEVIRRIASPDPKLNWAGEVMDRQVRHLTRLVEELLDVARISQGKISLNRESVELCAVIAQAIETAQPFIDARGHTLRVTLPEQPVWLQGDFSRLSQVLANLLHNAAKYSEEGGRIELELRVDNGEALIGVRDNGIGIDAALLPRIFDLFAQGSRSLDRSQGGLGVGLTLARRLVELHGGRLDAASDGLRKGAQFTVRIPCVSVVRSGDSAQHDLGAPAAVQGRRILIVDDNEDAAESIARYLELEGHEVKAVGDGAQALACAPVFAPHIVVLDIGLPGLSGYDVARRLREMPATASALLVALTGYGQKDDRLRAAEAGFDHHFVKPTDPRKLVELIAQWPSQHVASVRSVGSTP